LNALIPIVQDGDTQAIPATEIPRVFGPYFISSSNNIITIEEIRAPDGWVLPIGTFLVIVPINDINLDGQPLYLSFNNQPPEPLVISLNNTTAATNFTGSILNNTSLLLFKSTSGYSVINTSMTSIPLSNMISDNLLAQDSSGFYVDGSNIFAVNNSFSELPLENVAQAYTNLHLPNFINATYVDADVLTIPASNSSFATGFITYNADIPSYYGTTVTVTLQNAFVSADQQTLGVVDFNYGAVTVHALNRLDNNLPGVIDTDCQVNWIAIANTDEYATLSLYAKLFDAMTTGFPNFVYAADLLQRGSSYTTNVTLTGTEFNNSPNVFGSTSASLPVKMGHLAAYLTGSRTGALTPIPALDHPTTICVPTYIWNGGYTGTTCIWVPKPYYTTVPSFVSGGAVNSPLVVDAGVWKANVGDASGGNIYPVSIIQYQWRLFNGTTYVNIAGATSATYTPTAAGTYSCQIKPFYNYYMSIVYNIDGIIVS
jgi:hypothetical protein